MVADVEGFILSEEADTFLGGMAIVGYQNVVAGLLLGELSYLDNIKPVDRLSIG